MVPVLKSLRALADPTRLRMVALLEGEELSVQELQEITRLGQSRISTHLGLLQESGLVRCRREGKRAFYRVAGELESPTADIVRAAVAGAAELEEQARAAGSDDAPLAITGRLISDEGPVPPLRAGDPLELTRMSPAALLSRWHDVAGLDVYRAYIAAEVPLAGLQAISSPAPADAPLNWLNIFYAREWAVFAGFAF